MAWNKTKAVVLYVVILAALYGSFEPGPATSYSGGGFMPMQRTEPPPETSPFGGGGTGGGY